jgi:hypothetical protein
MLYTIGSHMLYAICEPIVYSMWEVERLTTLIVSTACYRDSFNFMALKKCGVTYRSS